MGVVGHPVDSLNLTEMFVLALIEFSTFIEGFQRKFYQFQKAMHWIKKNKGIKKIKIIMNFYCYWHVFKSNVNPKNFFEIFL